jgi:lycopene cyclase domain-containing protein
MDYKWRNFEVFLMIPDHLTYLFLNLVTLAGPFSLSFDKKVEFHKSWKYFAKAMLLTSSAYLLWDIWFTKTNIWFFNPKFLIGKYFINLPLEEYLFFIIIPYACLFIYACVKAYFPTFSLKKSLKVIVFGLMALSIIFISKNPSNLYTTVTFVLLFITLGALVYFKNTDHLSHLFLSWGIALLPMAYVNGILTSKPVLIYNDTQNLGIRIGTIPIEDFFYNMVYMLWMITIYERLKSKDQIKKNANPR